MRRSSDPVDPRPVDPRPVTLSDIDKNRALRTDDEFLRLVGPSYAPAPVNP